MIQIRISEPIREDSDYNTSKEPTNPPWERIHQFIWCIACEQAVRGALAVGREKEGELAITSLEFEYLHWKSRCEMLIGGDDISNDVITLGTYCSIFVSICALSTSHFFCSEGLTAQLTGSHRGIEGGIQIPETWWQAPLPFSTQPPKRPGELAFRLFDVPWLEWSQIMFLIWVILKECTQCISWINPGFKNFALLVSFFFPFFFFR